MEIRGNPEVAVLRGGSFFEYGDVLPVCTCLGDHVSGETASYEGFRVVLYIK